MKNKSKNIDSEISQRLSAIMKIIGSIKTEKKAKSSRENGKKGGRPINPDSIRQKKLKKECTKPIL